VAWRQKATWLDNQHAKIGNLQNASAWQTFGIAEGVATTARTFVNS